MANNESFEDLERLLDQESDAQFGEPKVRDFFDPAADPNKSAKLSGWTAEDFASIYVRFRPHLVRHANRYTSSPQQSEEIVQDAFLYLMTTLPELDSELGVLKFLKWKTKMLAYDLHKLAVSKREITGIFPEDVSSYQEIDEDLERVEDAAIIRLALAKLNPRQRAAIVATVYEDKSNEELAAQMGISTNNARQLLFRARSSFRKALVGEAEVQGKTVAEILSVAAKHAAKSARDSAGRLSVAALLGVGLVAGFQALSVETDVVQVAERATNQAQTEITQVPSSPAETSASTNDESIESVENFEGTSLESQASDPDQSQTSQTFAPEIGQQDSVTNESVERVSTLDKIPPEIITLDSQTVMNRNLESAGMYVGSSPAKNQDFFEYTPIEVFAGTGISAFLDYDGAGKNVSGVMFQLNAKDEIYFAQAKSNVFERTREAETYLLEISSSEFYFFDENGAVFSDVPMSNSLVDIGLRTGLSGEPLGASMSLSSAG